VLPVAFLNLELCARDLSDRIGIVTDVRPSRMNAVFSQWPSRLRHVDFPRPTFAKRSISASP
jgi:hypothetical protein